MPVNSSVIREQYINSIRRVVSALHETSVISVAFGCSPIYLFVSFATSVQDSDSIAQKFVAMSKVMREQHVEMQNTFASIREKIVQAQKEIHKHRDNTVRLEEEKVESDQRFEAARGKCTSLRNEIVDKERDLSDAEHQIPSAKSRMYELESISGENTHFKKTLESTRLELEETEKKRNKSGAIVKERSEDYWQAKQNLHKLELAIEEAERKIDFNTRRIVVARDKIGIATAHTSSVSQNYTGKSKVELESKLDEWEDKAGKAKEYRKTMEEKVLQMTWKTEELEKKIKYYYNQMTEMYSGQRELASSKLL